MFICPIPNYACEPILAVKQGRPVLFWEALFRGKKEPDTNWERIDQKLIEYLANNKPEDKWKRKTLAVNLSTYSVLGIEDEVIKAAAENWSLCLEWTEDYATQTKLHSAAEQLVEWRKRYGVLLAVDDVGAGMDGLLRISLLQPDALKIDGNFLKMAMSSVENKEILQHMIQHFSSKKVTVVAEHIETSRHLSFARSIGCNAWQGFWSRESRFGYI
jgi:EAL domain-containing protein (putative c-di-GMP-specific phosphodiesterase class I)